MMSSVGKNNQQRRAAKAKQRHRRASTVPPEPRPPAEDAFVGWDQEQRRRDEAYALLQTWSRAAALMGAESLRYVVASELRRHGPDVLAVVEEQLVGELSARVSAAWEYGWEPRDLAHAAGKNARVRAHAVALIAAQARATGAATRAPQRWRDQLAELHAEAPLGPSRWRPVAGAEDQIQTWSDLLLLLKLLAELVPLEPVGPRPSQWGRQAAASTSRSTKERDRLLTRIRGLLAKAEATDHPAEAETFTAKAQELMTRHAVDEAVLRGEQHEDVPVETRRVHLQSPYAGVKAALLAAVARPNRCRTVLLDRYDIAVLVGTPLDVEQAEILFISLLIQATRAMADAGHRRAGSFDRSATFRRSFLTAYATRIGERLEQADRSTTATYGAELVPVLQREADAVSAEFERRFPHTRTMGSGFLDRRGWEAGRAAADRAALVAGQIPA
jgi:hypothetical protein